MYDAESNNTKRTNIATGEVTEFEWDYRNRLTRNRTKVNDQGAITKDVVYVYDLFDRRITKSVDSDGARPGTAQVERYVYDGVHIALSFDGTGGQTHRYLHGPMVDQILSDENSAGQVIWSLTDNLGTVRDLVDSAGVIKNHIKYDSFGRITDETNAATDFFFACDVGPQVLRAIPLKLAPANVFQRALGSFRRHRTSTKSMKAVVCGAEPREQFMVLLIRILQCGERWQIRN